MGWEAEVVLWVYIFVIQLASLTILTQCSYIAIAILLWIRRPTKQIATGINTHTHGNHDSY